MIKLFVCLIVLVMPKLWISTAYGGDEIGNNSVQMGFKRLLFAQKLFLPVTRACLYDSDCAADSNEAYYLSRMVQALETLVGLPQLILDDNQSHFLIGGRILKTRTWSRLGSSILINSQSLRNHNNNNNNKASDEITDGKYPSITIPQAIALLVRPMAMQINLRQEQIVSDLTQSLEHFSRKTYLTQDLEPKENPLTASSFVSQSFQGSNPFYFHLVVDDGDRLFDLSSDVRPFVKCLTNQTQSPSKIKVHSLTWMISPTSVPRLNVYFKLDCPAKRDDLVYREHLRLTLYPKQYRREGSILTIDISNWIINARYF